MSRRGMGVCLEIPVFVCKAGHLPVVLGCAAARDLSSVSFADLFDEQHETGYQRPFDESHSRDFRSYMERDGSTTIPLTFNLRGAQGEGWDLVQTGRTHVLRVRRPSGRWQRVMAQVDCQHRIGMMGDSDLPLTFQCYLGLARAAEMEIFHVINAKAKGLSSSLLDYQSAILAGGSSDVPIEILVAKRLNDDPSSVWHKRVKLGGSSTQGVHRITSLRGLQSATRLLLSRSSLASSTHLTFDQKYAAVSAFWSAVAKVWTTAWDSPRSHLITKGIGVTALSLLAVDVITAIVSRRESMTSTTFESYLLRLARTDWSNRGPFRAYGGRRGAHELHQELRTRLFDPGLSVAAG